MNNVTVIGGNFTSQQLALIKNTAAKDCNGTEFDEFIHVCQHTGLDPLRRQIYAMVFSKDNPNKRQMTIIIGIDGYRATAARCGDYRPNDKPTEFVYRDDLKCEHTNPLGIESATVTVYKHAHDDWFPVVATAYWDEYAPIVEKAWQERKLVTLEQPYLDDKGMWCKMPRQMLEKCATAKAIRSGWPETFGGVYDEAEMDQMKTLDLTPSEWAERAGVEKRLELVGGTDAITIDWLDGSQLDRVPLGQLADRIFEFIDANKDEPSALEVFQDRNRHAMQEFWARNKSDALEVKKRLESAS